MFPLLNWLKNGGSSKLEVFKKCPIYLIKQTFLSTLKFEEPPFLSQLILENVAYLKRKPTKHTFELYNKNWNIYYPRANKPIFVKIVFFHSRGYGKPLDGAMPILFQNSKSSLIGLSNGTSFVAGFFLKMAKKGKIFY